jgi:myo-inositol-1(or 4)-monophosphatase
VELSEGVVGGDLDLTNLDFENILVGARAAAREAAALVLPGFRKRPDIEHKGATDLVTEFDRASEKLLRERLHALFPFAKVVGEEAGAEEDDDADDLGDIRFYVDPIDGTTNFVHGHPFWCISIGLVVKGSPVLGVVRAPALGVEWFGSIGAPGAAGDAGRAARAVRCSLGGANDNGASPRVIEEECRVSPTVAFVESLLATGFPYDRSVPAPHNNFDAFMAIKRKCQAVRRCGSAALDLCLVADGTYDGYWERKLNPWDLAAGVALVRAAGGSVTGFTGESENLLPVGNIVATNGRIHDVLLRELGPFTG